MASDIKRMLPDRIVFTYQGDGDLASIGMGEIVRTAARGENITVIFIPSPLVRHPRAAVVMNLPSLDKHEPLVKPGGLLVVNTSMANRPVRRTDGEVIALPAAAIAEALGDRRPADMGMVGALLARLPVLSLEDVERALAPYMLSPYPDRMARNVLALREGPRLAWEAVPIP